jgi:hypothetical protein
MRTRRIASIPNLTALALAAVATSHAGAGAHTWDVNEVFSNADGTIQFIELREPLGGAGEVNVNGHNVTSSARSYTIPAPALAPPSGFKHLLFATPAFAALPGAPTPDYVFPAGSVPFFSIVNDTISYTPFDAWTFGAGLLPTDGVNSLNRDLTTGPNSPTNYAGHTGSVNANPGPPAVPDGDAGSTPMTAAKLDAAGTRLSISWDTATCSGAADHQILFGEGSQLPTAPGGVFGVSGGVCGLGAASSFLWDPAPDAADGTGLVWWLVVVQDGTGAEGSWGLDGSNTERQGPGGGGSSAECGAASRNTNNTCGN